MSQGVSVSHAEKIASRITFTDWENRCDEFHRISRNLCENSFENRRNSAQIRLNTAIKTRWDTYYNEAKLTDRIWSVEEGQARLQESLSDIIREVDTLTKVKSELETALQNLTLPLSVSAECVSFRDARREAELTRDEPAQQLQQELRVLENQKSNLLSLGTEAWQNQERLESLNAELDVARSEQKNALLIDREAISLTPLSPGISMRPEPTRLPPESSVPAGWESHCHLLTARQHESCKASRQLRDAMLAAIAQCCNSAKAQFESVNCALRERVFTLERAIHDLDFQRDQILSEMGRVRCELNRLDESRRSLTAPRALCETRHELRTSRPAGPERCQDPPQDGLAEESLAIQESQTRIDLAIAEARTSHECLRAQLARIERETEDKQAALGLEKRCQKIRNTLINDPDQSSHFQHAQYANSANI